MLVKKRHYKLPPELVDIQKHNMLTSDLYICELAEVIIDGDTIENTSGIENHLLFFCSKGKAKLTIANDQVPIGQNQFCILPQGFKFKLEVDKRITSVFFICYFNGNKVAELSKNFSVVRDVIQPVNNMVANRSMLFDEIFNNLGKGFYNFNIEYVCFCFGHLLATFIYAHKTSEDIQDEQNPVISRTLLFLEQNLEKKLSLKTISDEAGLSPTYLSTIFKRSTGYSPLSYFSHLKIMQACEYLDHSRLKIKEIAFKLGYSDPYYFSKDFIKRMGISPKKYRNRFLQQPSI